VTPAELKQHLRYEPDTGRWFWVKTGKEAGSIEKGRRRVCVFGQRYFASRLAWFYMKGKWPQRDIDHKNRNPSDDSWSNLRQATRQQNNHNRSRAVNNTSGHKGVCFDKSRGTWQARIQIGKFMNLGRFKTKEAAAEAYHRAAQEHFGEFAP